MAQGRITKYQLIVVGGSAGSLEAVLKIAEVLPVHQKIAALIIVHRKNDAKSILASLLSARTHFAVKEIEDKERILPGCIYIAPANYHVLFENKSQFSLDSSEKVNHCRPSIDVSFESAAEVFGETVIAILLSGANADGAAGIHKIKQAGGFTIVHDPASAEVDFMPQQALEQMKPDKVLSSTAIAAFLKQLLQ
ncbi:chemotaxis protein CheB [Parafilimonas sp.]|uniref:chemotaxis protein CheB n=1 Tax=Parafilimonas sp. TaxID=1969739 RepID=UPI0039E3FE79